MDFKKRITEELKLSKFQAEIMYDEYIKVCERLAKEYHAEQCAMNDVVGRSEQLPKCEHKNIIREDGLDECLDCGVRNY